MNNMTSDTRPLPTHQIADNIRPQIDFLDKLIKRTSRRLDNSHELPKGTVRIIKHNKTYQYYFKTQDSGKYRYVREKEKPMIRKIVQSQYDEKILSWMESARNTLVKCAENLEALDILDIYDSMGDGRKEATTPVIMNDEMYIDFWMHKYEGDGNQKYGTGSYQTMRGEFARSKSEKILADTFYNMNIPYQYEPELKLKNGMVFHPDFILLNINQRKTIIWEHLGMISDADYAMNSLSKIRIYESNDILLGRDLIITSESSDIPLKTSEIVTKLNNFILN